MCDTYARTEIFYKTNKQKNQDGKKLHDFFGVGTLRESCLLTDGFDERDAGTTEISRDPSLLCINFLRSYSSD